MIETYTPTSNSICNDGTEPSKMNTVFTKSEICFYESIKPALNLLVKEPSEEKIREILAFSKAL